MAEPFDPYLRWLGIRDAQRPPNHYRLLGLDLFENDGDVIAVAADRQMAHVRTFQAGQFAGVSQRLLNELAAARICLLKPEKKAVYDAQLKKQLGDLPVAGRPKPQSAAAAEEFSDFGSLTSESSPNGLAASPATNNPAVMKSIVATRKSKSLGPWIGLAAAGILLVVGVIVVQSMSDSTHVASSDRSENHSPATTDTPALSNSIQPKNQYQGTADKGQGTGKRPLDEATQPPPKSSPPEPPVHSPRDVASVDNPPQHDPSEKSQSPDKPPPANPDKPGNPDKTEPSNTQPSKPAVEAPPKSELLAVPDKEAQAAAEKTIQSIYKADFEQANHGGPEAKAEFAKQLLARGLETSDNPAARYVLLTKARDLAVAGGDVSVASNAVKKLLELYAMDRAQEQLFACLSGLAKSVRSREAAEALRIAADHAADDAIADDNYESAAKFARLAMGMANKLGDQSLAAKRKIQLTEIEQCKKEYAKLADTLVRLRTDPDDAEANLAVGLFFGLTKGDFDEALPYLAKGSDTALKGLAQKDLSAPAEPAEQAKLGDAWWTLAEANHEPAKSHLQAHAANWYSKAVPKLKGLTKGEIESRLKEVENSNRIPIIPKGASFIRILIGNWKIHFAPNPSSPYPAGFDYQQQFFENGTWKNQYNTGHWVLNGDTITCTHDSRSDLLQKYQIVGDSLRGQHYQPPDKPVNDGVGTKVR